MNLRWVAVAVMSANAMPGWCDVPRVPRADSPIVLDGQLAEPAWRGALVIETFYETAFGDNRTPLVSTIAYVTHDDHFLYVAVRCHDPQPSRLRAPYTERDRVGDDDDHVALFISAGPGRVAQEFRVTPRAVQGDGLYNDDAESQDLSADFYYDSAARVEADGWTAEVRIPFSSLRYESGAQAWRLLVSRIYPRERRFKMVSQPIPRGSSCFVCHALEMRGMEELRSPSHLVLAPYVAGQATGAPGSAAARQEGVEPSFGLDLKWAPASSTAFDVAIRPDFSHVESDVAQITANNRFALAFPEKRPFFFEGRDLFDTPFQAVYTRSITDPVWGARTTGRSGSTAFTVLAAQDAGGGQVVLPGPEQSTLVPQDFRSWATIGRVRRDIGRSYVGVLYAGREMETGAHNRVFGPDFSWRPGGRDQLVMQALVSDTRAGSLSPLEGAAAGWGHALHLGWNHTTRGLDWFLRIRDVSDAFRADDGFVPQVGYREAEAVLQYKLFPEGVLNSVIPYVRGQRQVDEGGELLNQELYPGIEIRGKHRLSGGLNLGVVTTRAGARRVSLTKPGYRVQLGFGKSVVAVGVNGFFGSDLDLATGSIGTGGYASGFALLRPRDRLEAQLDSAVQWLGSERQPPHRAKLFRSQAHRVRMLYALSSRAFARVVAQYTHTVRYASPEGGAERRGDASATVLLSYRVNWQTALFVGYGDQRRMDERHHFDPQEWQLFAKCTYAFQR